MPKYTEGAMRAAREIVFGSYLHGLDAVAEIIDRETAKDRSELVEALQAILEGHIERLAPDKFGCDTCRAVGKSRESIPHMKACLIASSEAALRKAGVL